MLFISHPPSLSRLPSPAHAPKINLYLPFLIKARRNHLRALKEIRRAAGVERDSHVASVQFELEAFRRRAGRSIRKERKRSRAYKAQAIEAHKRGLRARHVLETRANAMTAAAEAGLFARRGNALGAGRGREQMDSTSSTFGAVSSNMDFSSRAALVA